MPSPEDLPPPRKGSKRENLENSVPRTITLNHFWQGVIKGSFSKITPAEVEKITRERYFSFPPLTELDAEEVEQLRSLVQKYLSRHLNSSTLESLIESDVFYVDAANLPKIYEALKSKSISPYNNGKGYLFIFDPGYKNEVREILERSNMVALSLSEKLKLYKQPDFWHANVSDYNESGGSFHSEYFTDFDIGGLDDYFPLVTRESFPALVSEIRERTKQKKLKMLDVGGAAGEALFDAKVVDGDIETYNLTLVEEPLTYPVDHLVLGTAERMPKDFEESMHLILCNRTFKFALYHDLALSNITKALAVGGEARIQFRIEGAILHGLPREEVSQRLKKVFGHLQDLQSRGLISVDVKMSWGKSLEELLASKRDPTSLVGQMKITKHKSMLG